MYISQIAREPSKTESLQPKRVSKNIFEKEKDKFRRRIDKPFWILYSIIIDAT